MTCSMPLCRVYRRFHTPAPHFSHVAAPSAENESHLPNRPRAWQHALRLDAGTQIGLGHHIENIRSLFARKEVHRVEGARHIEAIRPFQNVPSSWVLVCSRADVHPFAVNTQVNGLNMNLWFDRHDAAEQSGTRRGR